MFEISVIGGFLLFALITSIIFPSDMDKSYSERKGNSKFYKKTFSEDTSEDT
jgi:hypothetical protein